jgi:hypothetical protein
MSVYFLAGMHLVKSIDEAVAVQLFNEIADFSSKVRNTSDNWAIDEYDYISSNINNEKVYVDKINVLLVPEMIVGTMTMHEYEVSKHKVIGFDPDYIVPVLGSNDICVKNLLSEMNPLEVDENTKVASVCFCGHTPSTVEEASIVPLYYKGKLVYKPNCKGGNTMTFFNMDGEWVENVIVYYDIETGEFAVVKDEETLGGNLSEELYGVGAFEHNIYGFYRIVYDERIGNNELAGDNLVNKVGDYIYLYSDGKCTVDLTNVKKDSVIILPNGVIDTSIRFDEIKLTSNVSVILPTSSKILRGYIDDTDRFKVIASKKSDLKCMVYGKEIELHTDDLDEIKSEYLKHGLNIEFY